MIAIITKRVNILNTVTSITFVAIPEIRLLALPSFAYQNDKFVEKHKTVCTAKRKVIEVSGGYTHATTFTSFYKVRQVWFNKNIAQQLTTCQLDFEPF